LALRVEELHHRRPAGLHPPDRADLPLLVQQPEDRRALRRQPDPGAYLAVLVLQRDRRRTLLRERIDEAERAVLVAERERGRALGAETELRPHLAVAVHHRHARRPVGEEPERGTDLALVVGDGQAGRAVGLHPETRAQLVVRAEERHEGEIFVRDAEAGADASPRVLDLALAPPDDPFAHPAASPRPDVDLSLGRAGGAMCVLCGRWRRAIRSPTPNGVLEGGAGTNGRDVRNRRDPKVTAVSRGGLYGRPSKRSTRLDGFCHSFSSRSVRRVAASSRWGSGSTPIPGPPGPRT